MALEALMGTCCIQTYDVYSVRNRNRSRFLFHKGFWPPDKLRQLFKCESTKTATRVYRY